MCASPLPSGAPIGCGVEYGVVSFGKFDESSSWSTWGTRSGIGGLAEITPFAIGLFTRMMIIMPRWSVEERR